MGRQRCGDIHLPAARMRELQAPRVKMQAVAGCTAAVWFKSMKIGSYHGQCSVLCGKLHSAMPIVVRVVDQPVYDAWMAALKAKDKKKAQQILNDDTASQAVFQSVAQAQ